MTHHCFTYGSLMCPDIMTTASGVPQEALTARSARLHDYSRHPVVNEVYPALVPQPGASVDGLLYLDLPASAWDRLDQFEGEMYERKSVVVVLADHTTSIAETYVFRAKHSHRLGKGSWDFDAFLRQGKASFSEQYLGFSLLRQLDT